MYASLTRVAGIAWGGPVAISRVAQQQARGRCSSYWSCSSLSTLLDQRRRRKRRSVLWNSNDASSRLSTSLYSTTATLTQRTHQSEDEDPYAACWSSVTFKDNDKPEINGILGCLQSPAPHGLYVIERALYLCKQDPNRSIQDTLDQIRFWVKPGYHFCIASDIQEHDTYHQPSIDWSMRADDCVDPGEGWEHCFLQTKYPSAKQMADGILDYVIQQSDAQCPISETRIESMLDQLNARLDLTLCTDIRGRVSADTAFTLALAGVTRKDIYDKILRVAFLEFERTKNRLARGPQGLVHVVEKLAASGLKGKEVENLYQSVLSCEVIKQSGYDALKKHLEQPSTFNLLSPRPLMWLWKFSSRQVKVRAQSTALDTDSSPFSSVSNANMWIDKLEDPSKPLVVDIGCGFGTSLLGLASLRGEGYGALNNVNFSDCNFVGGDLSQLGTRFAQGISKRWGLDTRLQFCCSAAEGLLDQIQQENKGNVAMILIQFPSPYRLNQDGNSQLPSDRESGFMVTESMMEKVSQLLTSSGGQLLLQSNCEDIAVLMRDMGLKHGIKVIPAEQPVMSEDMYSQPTQRTRRWIEQGGQRAIGLEWSSVPLLPPGCVTETEASYQINDTPIYRCLMQAK